MKQIKSPFDIIFGVLALVVVVYGIQSCSPAEAQCGTRENPCPTLERCETDEDCQVSDECSHLHCYDMQPKRCL